MPEYVVWCGCTHLCGPHQPAVKLPQPARWCKCPGFQPGHSSAKLSDARAQTSHIPITTTPARVMIHGGSVDAGFHRFVQISMVICEPGLTHSSLVRSKCRPDARELRHLSAIVALVVGRFIVSVRYRTKASDRYTATSKTQLTLVASRVCITARHNSLCWQAEWVSLQDTPSTHCLQPSPRSRALCRAPQATIANGTSASVRPTSPGRAKNAKMSQCGHTLEHGLARENPRHTQLKSDAALSCWKLDLGLAVLRRLVRQIGIVAVLRSHRNFRVLHMHCGERRAAGRSTGQPTCVVWHRVMDWTHVQS
jgi:hypothetical protein